MGAVARWAVRVPGGVVPLLTCAAVVMLVSVGASRGLWLSNLHNGLLALVCSAVGVYVLRERPGQRVGGLLLATGLVEAVLFSGRQVALADGAAAAPWVAWFGVWPLAAGLTLTTLAVLCFPDGRLPSPAWAPIARTVVVIGLGCAAVSALWPVEYEATGVGTPHPFSAGAPRVVDGLWSAVAHPAYAALQLLWVVAFVVRWRHSGAHVRQQLAWLVAAAGLSALALVGGLAIAGTPRPGLLTAVLVPVAAGIAIVHGQQLAAVRALRWLSRTRPDSADLPAELAATAAQALSAEAGVLWMGPPDQLHAVGVWPDLPDPQRPTTWDQLAGRAGSHAQLVLHGGEPIGAISIARTVPADLSRSERRLLDDLAAQSALVLHTLDLAGLVARERAEGHLESLTPREREVLDLMAQGLSNRAIAQTLHLSIKSVEPAVSAIFGKLELAGGTDSNRRVLAVVAYLRASGPPAAAVPPEVT